MTSHPDPIARLWTAARAMFARLREAIGETAAIARGALSDEERRGVRAWLRPLEIMARKIALTQALVLIEQGEVRAAAALTSPATSDARGPTLTLIAIPPQVRIVKPVASAPRTGRQRPPCLRLWPQAAASAGPRVRTLAASRSAASVQRDHARLAFARRMRAAPRRPEAERLARRIEALARLLDKPLRAATRFARLLARRPDAPLKLALTPSPRTRLYAEPEYALASDGARDSFYAWRRREPRDSS